MTSVSGLSAVLTLSIIAILSINILKDQFMNVENYGDEHHEDMANPSKPFTYNTNNSNPVGESRVNIPNFNQQMTDETAHTQAPFGTGDFFRGAAVSPDASTWSNTSTAYKLYQANIQSATPTSAQLNTIGSETVGLPGPTAFGDSSLYAEANFNEGRASNLSLCAQNFNTFASGVGNSSVSASLLPNPNNPNHTSDNGFTGLSDCDTVNILANQTFLSRQAGGQIGTNTTASSLRNANQSIRSEPPNPMLNVGPWANSTIHPDLQRRPLEGCGPSFGLYGTGKNSSGVPTNIAP